MALIKIESAEVTKHIKENGAFEVAEYVTLDDGRSFPKYFAVWATGMAPAIGSVVMITGEMGAKAREYTTVNGATNIAVDVSVYKPNVTVLAAAKPATPEETAKAIDTMATEAINKSVPF